MYREYYKDMLIIPIISNVLFKFSDKSQYLGIEWNKSKIENIVNYKYI